MRGHSLTAIGGGDRTAPLPAATYSEPKKRQTGLDWSQHRAPEPVVPAPEVMPATKAQAYAEQTNDDDDARARETVTVNTYENVKTVVSREQIEFSGVPEPVDPPHPVVVLLNLTADDKRPEVVSARALVVAGLEHLRLVATAPAPKRPTPTRRLVTAEPRPRRTTPHPATANTSKIVELYQSGKTINEVSAETGHAKGTVRRHLINAGTELRDDRHTRSGGYNRRVDTPEQVEAVRAAYVDERLSKDRTAAKLGLTLKVVEGIMLRNGIEARKGQSGGGDTLVELRARLERLGVTNAEVRAWAVTQRLEVSVRGVIPLTVLDAYEQAHQ